MGQANMEWKLKSGETRVNGSTHVTIGSVSGRVTLIDSVHATITESTSGMVACGESWCDGGCGLPALVLTHGTKELRAFGAMVAMGPVFQHFRIPWVGKKLPITPGDVSVEVLLKRFWM